MGDKFNSFTWPIGFLVPSFPPAAAQEEEEEEETAKQEDQQHSPCSCNQSRTNPGGGGVTRYPTDRGARDREGGERCSNHDFICVVCMWSVCGVCGCGGVCVRRRGGQLLC